MNGRMARWVGGLLAALVLSVPGVALAQYGFFVPDAGVPAALSVTTSSANVALAGTGATTVVSNTGTVAAHCRFGDSTVVAAATDSVILAGTQRAYGTAGVYLACITGAGSTSITAETGIGTPVIAGGGGSGASGTVTTSPLAVATTDKSGTIAAGATAQTAIALNASRKGWCIQNPSTAAAQGIATAESLWIRVSGTAAPNVGTELTPGNQACNSPGLIDTAAVSVYATTISHKYNGFEVQ